MPKRSRKKPAKDFNQIARSIVDRTTGASTPKKKRPIKKQDATDIARADSEGMAQPQSMRPKKNPSAKKDPAAVALGRKGGLKGGPARAAKLSKEQLRESARKAARARWSKSTD